MSVGQIANGVGHAGLDVDRVVLTAAAAAAAGFAGGSLLLQRSLAYVEIPVTRAARITGRAAGGLAGAAAVLATRQAGSWWLLPCFLVWAYSLAAAATCDAFAQRVPVTLVVPAAAGTAVLLVIASTATGTWRWAEFGGISAAAAGAIFAWCWRFAGAGFGDVRLAVLAGLGWAHPTLVGLVLGILAFVIITAGQVVVTRRRHLARDATLPLGPALAIAVILAAIA